MRVLIVDDEQPARARLTRLVAEIGFDPVGEADNGEEAIAMARKLRPDAVLLDIRMPGMDGLEAARRLAELEPAPAVIFTTAYGEHALEAFDAQAVAYLLKPVRAERLTEALRRARRPTAAQIQTLQGNEGREYLSGGRAGHVERIPAAEVLYFRAEDKYVTAYHPGGELLLEESLKQLEEEFGERFVRIHRNALVARTALAGLEKEGEGAVRARLHGCDDRLEVSRRHLPSVRRLLRSGRP